MHPARSVSGRGTRLGSLLAAAFLLAIVLVASDASARPSIDTATLPRLMVARGFRPPARFKALVVEVKFDVGRRSVVSEKWFDWKGTADDRDDWNPASTVKLFAAIGALLRVREAGFSPAARVEFQGSQTQRSTVKELVRAAIIESDNIAYDRLVQLAGFRRLHQRVLVARYGIQRTALRRSYGNSRWLAMGERAELRFAPPIRLVEGKRKKVFPAASDDVPTTCQGAACTTPIDLAECMRRLMLQEQLPTGQHFGLVRHDLLVLREAMRSDRDRGNEVVDALRSSLKRRRVVLFSKPGFSEDWFSDNVYVFDPTRKKAWIVVLAGYPGRSSLTSAARIIGQILDKNELGR